MSDKAADKTALTDAESKFLLCALKHMEGTLNFDVEAVAKELNMKDAASVRARFNTIKRNKIAPAGGVDKNSPAKKSATPKKATAKAKKGKKEEGPAEKETVKDEEEEE